MMNYLESIEVTWNDTGTLLDNFGELCKYSQYDINQQNFNIVITKKKASLSEIVNGLIGVMGLELAIQDNYWHKLMVGIFAIAVVSPMNIHFFKHPSAKDIINLIDSEYGDKYLDVAKLNDLYADNPEVKSIVDSFIRKDLLEKEKDGRYYFASNAIKNFEINITNIFN